MRLLAYIRVPMLLFAMLTAASPTVAASGDGPSDSAPIPPEPSTALGDACMPELSALAMVERMARLMGKDADVLSDAEEDLRSQAADCLDGDDDMIEVSNTAMRHEKALERPHL